VLLNSFPVLGVCVGIEVLGFGFKIFLADTSRHLSEIIIPQANRGKQDVFEQKNYSVLLGLLGLS
jgi:hypothetical protein